MKTRHLLAALGALAVATPALASLELAQKNACTACHAVDKKLVGPAYNEVPPSTRATPRPRRRYSTR